MENFGSEIGQKMRSAVKAKLLELGTGGSAGYIDDELPDYVMIMVANKRSKLQMISDLNLFLGTRTELFVTWLHEVLQKLQEVTLPTVNVVTKKRKHSQKDELLNKKDKKSIRKEKKISKKTLENEPTEDDNFMPSSNSACTVSNINSINDVFAEDLLEKAKKSLEVTICKEAHIKTVKERESVIPENSIEIEHQEGKETNDFDIPTISEISSTTEIEGCPVVSGNREKDLAELAEIQKRIYAAKRHLKQLGEFSDNGGSEEEDFLCLKADGSDEDLNEANDAVNVVQEKTSKIKSPIIFSESIKDNLIEGSDMQCKRKKQTPSTLVSAITTPKDISNKSFQGTKRIEELFEVRKIRPIHERLGSKPLRISRARPVRQEKELYVPAFRRKRLDSGREKERERNKQKGREIDINERKRDRCYENDNKRENMQKPCSGKESSLSLVEQERPSSNTSPRHRIGSRVIVAPAKHIESSDEENTTGKPVNSVIKIKPRPPVSPSKQACKNLLLRAVAEAQRSTILAKSIVKDNSKMRALRVGVGNDHNTKLYTKSYRNRLKQNTVSSSSSLLSRKTKNLVIKVDQLNSLSTHGQQCRQSDNVISDPEECISDVLSDRDESDLECLHNSQAIDNDEFTAHDVKEIHKEIENAEYKTKEVIYNKDFITNTQFVVTLNAEEQTPKYRKRTADLRIRSISPLPQVSSSSATQLSDNVSTSTTPVDYTRSRDSHKRDFKSRILSSGSPSAAKYMKEGDSYSSAASNTPTRQSERIEIYRKPKDIKKIIIQNDSEDEEISCKKPLPKSRGLRSNEHMHTERSTTPPLPPVLKRSIEQEKDKAMFKSSPSRNKRKPIKFDLDKEFKKLDNNGHFSEYDTIETRSGSRDRAHELPFERRSQEDHQKISIRGVEAKKYDNIPALSSVSIDSIAMKVMKPKERCKYHPNCIKQFCDYYHPTAPCKSFPNCKFAEKCMYSHPKCKYDMSCTNIDCNFSHSASRNPILLKPTAPPLPSHVVPVQNYKSISAAPAASSAMCKYYPNCSKIGCTFYHPKPCRFGKNCINKLECNFYHHEIQSSSKFKWVASAVP